MIYPAAFFPSFRTQILEAGLFISRIRYVHSSPGRPARVVLVEMAKSDKSSWLTESPLMLAEHAKSPDLSRQVRAFCPFL